MFKNLMIFRVVPEWNANLAKAIEQAERKQFVECGASQAKSLGWVAPRAEHGALIESVGGQWIMKVMIEKKTVPASVLNKKTDARMKKIEEQTGRKPKRKEIKDEVLRELLPQAFPKSESVVVWLDPKKRLVSIDVGSASKADEITTLMVDTFEGFGLTMIQTNLSAATAMSGWLREREAPAGFTIDRDCQLKSTDEGKSAVTYAKHGLDGRSAVTPGTGKGTDQAGDDVGRADRIRADRRDAGEEAALRRRGVREAQGRRRRWIRREHSDRDGRAFEADPRADRCSGR